MGFETLFILMFYFMLFGLAMGAFVALALYFLPLIIAAARKHNQILPITLITIFLGWTFLGWLAAVIWSLSPDVQCSCGKDECENS